MRHYRAKIVGVRFEGRSKYVHENLKAGDRVRCVPEFGNMYDADAVAVFHGTTRIGYLPSTCIWLKESIAEGDLHDISVTNFEFDDEGELSVVGLDVGLEDQRVEPPPPATGQRVIATLGDELKVLICIARSDERLVRAERELLLRYAEERCSDEGLTFDPVTATYVERWIKKQSPGSAEMREIIDRLAVENRNALDALFQVSEIIAEMPNRKASGAQQVTAEAREMMRNLLSGS